MTHASQPFRSRVARLQNASLGEKRARLRDGRADPEGLVLTSRIQESWDDHDGEAGERGRDSKGQSRISIALPSPLPWGTDAMV